MGKHETHKPETQGALEIDKMALEISGKLNGMSAEVRNLAVVMRRLAENITRTT